MLEENIIQNKAEQSFAGVIKAVLATITSHTGW